MTEARLAQPKKRRSPKRDLEVPRPWLKFVGGKTRLLPELCKRLPAKFGRYHEPFVGGGALFWHLQREGLLKGGAVLSDANERLIRAYRGIWGEPETVIELLRQYAALHAERGARFFEQQRVVPIDGRCDAAVAAWLIYVNRACFNGLYRLNKKGKFNTSFGDGSPIVIDEENLRACARALGSGVDLCTLDFEVSVQNVFRGDAVYFDPPYVPVSKTANFDSYTADGFTEKDQRRLATYARRLKQNGAHVLLTNSDHPFVRELYPEPFWKVERVEVRGDALNTDGAKRGKVGELIIS
jgi:DNA adenine methylase